MEPTNRRMRFFSGMEACDVRMKKMEKKYMNSGPIKNNDDSVMATFQIKGMYDWFGRFFNTTKD
jgi:hypothetical protein